MDDNSSFQLKLPSVLLLKRWLVTFVIGFAIQFILVFMIYFMEDKLWRWVPFGFSLCFALLAVYIPLVYNAFCAKRYCKSFWQQFLFMLLLPTSWNIVVLLFFVVFSYMHGGIVWSFNYFLM